MLELIFDESLAFDDKSFETNAAMPAADIDSPVACPPQAAKMITIARRRCKI